MIFFLVHVTSKKLFSTPLCFPPLIILVLIMIVEPPNQSIDRLHPKSLRNWFHDSPLSTCRSNGIDGQQFVFFISHSTSFTEFPFSGMDHTHKPPNSSLFPAHCQPSLVYRFLHLLSHSLCQHLEFLGHNFSLFVCSRGFCYINQIYRSYWE